MRIKDRIYYFAHLSSCRTFIVVDTTQSIECSIHYDTIKDGKI